MHGDFDIDVYMDLNGDWVSGDANSKIQWFMQSIEFDDSGSLLSWQVQKEDDQTFVENGDRAEWGRLHFTGPTVRTQRGAARSLPADSSIRMSTMNAVIQKPSAESLPRTASFQTRSTITSATLARTSLSSPSTKLSSLDHLRTRLPAVCFSQ